MLITSCYYWMVSFHLQYFCMDITTEIVLQQLQSVKKTYNFLFATYHIECWFWDNSTVASKYEKKNL